MNLDSTADNIGPAKEGIVLDKDGQPLHVRAHQARANANAGPGGMRVRVYRGGWWLPLALGVGIPALFVFGIFIFTALMTLGLVFMLLRTLFGFGGGSVRARR